MAWRYIISNCKEKTTIHAFRVPINVEKQKDILQKYIDTENEIGGESHQSLTSIKQLKIESKVQAIVDSAPAKQMKYSPASGIPIYPPNWLNKMSNY